MTLNMVNPYASQNDQFVVDPSDEFQPGMIAQLKVVGNQVVCGVSDGTAPIGIIDDMRTKAFSTTMINETVQALVPSALIQTIDGRSYLRADFKVNLENPNVFESSFVSYDVPVVLIPRNGVVIFPEGTELNVDLTGGGVANGVRTIVNYTYQIPNIPGDDSTRGSNRVAVWTTRIRAATDQFDTSVRYQVGAPLFVGRDGKFTSVAPDSPWPSPAIVTGPPVASPGFLEFLWL